MDCAAIAERVAPYLDHELAPAEVVQLEEHLERCTACQALVSGVADQVFVRPRVPRMDDPDVWDAMDRALAREARRIAKDAAPRPTWELRLGVGSALGYAAVLALTVLWGLHNHHEASRAAAQAQALAEQLEQTRLVRIPTTTTPTAIAPRLTPLQATMVAAHTPHRGTF